MHLSEKAQHIIGLSILLPWLAYILFKLYGEARTFRWPSLMGEMITSFIEKNEWDDDDSYTIKVKYTFKVNGISYLSERCRLHDLSYSFRWAAERRRKAFQVGAPVVVYYNPEDPREAVLIRGFNWIFLVMVPGVLLFALQLIPIM